jgi:hypothetical protein
VNLLKSFAGFWYEFIIGDDWKIAAAVAVALSLLGVVMLSTSLPDIALSAIGGGSLIAGFSITLVIDSRSHRR